MTSNWTDHLTHTGARIDTDFVTFDDPADTHGQPQITPLLHLGLIRCAGEDAAEFLHNLLSNDIKGLGANQVQWNSFNSPKGRMLASLLVFRDDDGFNLVVAADILPALQKKLSMYVLRSKVKVSTASDTALIGVSGSDAESIIEKVGFTLPADDMHQQCNEYGRCMRVNATTFILVLDAAKAPAVWDSLQQTGTHPAGTDTWHLTMIRAGLPLITTATQEQFVAQMLNYELIGGVNFSKGCYPGQEIVARTQYLGKVKKRMYRVHGDADELPRPGDDVFTPKFGQQSAGKVVNVAQAPEGGFEALVVMQTSCAETGRVNLNSADGPSLSLRDLPYALPEHKT